jgi:hypothetical protein
MAAVMPAACSVLGPGVWQAEDGAEEVEEVEAGVEADVLLSNT